MFCEIFRHRITSWHAISEGVLPKEFVYSSIRGLHLACLSKGCSGLNVYTRRFEPLLHFRLVAAAILLPGEAAFGWRCPLRHSPVFL